jgi:hypothetical protein
MDDQSWPSKRSLKKFWFSSLNFVQKKELKWINNGWSKLTIQERGLEKKQIDFQFLKTNKNLKQLGILIKNGTPSSNPCIHVLK